MLRLSYKVDQSDTKNRGEWLAVIRLDDLPDLIKRLAR